MFKEVYGIVNIRDYYTNESSSLLGIYGMAETPILVPVEISHNNVKVHEVINLKISESHFSIRSELGNNLFVKSETQFLVYKYAKENTLELIKEVETTGDYEVSMTKYEGIQKNENTKNFRNL